MEKEKQFLNVQDGNEFFAHEATVSVNQIQFAIDFKCVTPRTDTRGQVTSIKHNMVLLDPTHAKSLSTVLINLVKNYEEEFGEIKQPKPVKSKQKVISSESVGTPSYFG